MTIPVEHSTSATQPTELSNANQRGTARGRGQRRAGTPRRCCLSSPTRTTCGQVRAVVHRSDRRPVLGILFWLSSLRVTVACPLCGELSWLSPC